MPALATIIDATRAALPELRSRRRELERAAAARSHPPDFAAALVGDTVALVAEVKRRSPSAGAINEALDPVDLATGYALGGAAAISVLTDAPFFGGSLADLDAVVAAVARPVLRKDFILEETQLLEARARGASAALLIVRVLPQATLRRLVDFAATIGLAALVEAHAADEISRALEAGARIVGVNARDLDDFSIDRAAAWELIARIPADRIAVAESGMSSRTDVTDAAAAGADAVLIGSALARATSPADRAREFCGIRRHGR